MLGHCEGDGHDLEAAATGDEPAQTGIKPEPREQCSPAEEAAAVRSGSVKAWGPAGTRGDRVMRMRAG